VPMSPDNSGLRDQKPPRLTHEARRLQASVTGGRAASLGPSLFQHSTFHGTLGGNTIKYDAGSVVASESIADFEDFLSRLKTLNPGVDVTSFPTGWPSTKAPEARHERGSFRCLCSRSSTGSCG
jgi:hypothetical protein